MGASQRRKELGLYPTKPKEEKPRKNVSGYAVALMKFLSNRKPRAHRYEP